MEIGGSLYREACKPEYFLADMARNLEEMKREMRELDADLGFTADDSKEEGQFALKMPKCPDYI